MHSISLDILHCILCQAQSVNFDNPWIACSKHGSMLCPSMGSPNSFFEVTVVHTYIHTYIHAYIHTYIGLTIIGEQAKQARHSQVCSIENRDIYML